MRIWWWLSFHESAGDDTRRVETGVIRLATHDTRHVLSLRDWGEKWSLWVICICIGVGTLI